MLYSSSKEDLKRNLGAGYFKAEYSANVIADVTWDSYLASLERGLDLDLLTETEKLLLEERVSVAMCTCLYACMHVCMYVCMWFRRYCINLLSKCSTAIDADTDGKPHHEEHCDGCAAVSGFFRVTREAG